MTTLSCESENVGDSGNGQLLRDIEQISKALYLPKASRRPLISFLNVQLESAPKTLIPSSKSDEDERIKFNWPKKQLKAISRIWRRKFNCCFFCHVHHIEGLPSSFDGLDMSVHWKRKDDLLRTRASRVSNGYVEFEDTLMSKCWVYGDRSGQGKFVEYEPKQFLLYASVVGLEGLEIGKHWVDLTRLLPLVFEDLEEDKSSGKWRTSFKLEGEAKGATLHVSFGFLVMNKSLFESGDLVFNSKQSGLGFVESCGSGNERRCGGDENSDSDVEFTVTEKGIELERPMEEHLKLEEPAARKTDSYSAEMMAVAEIFKVEMEPTIETVEPDILNLFVLKQLESESLSVGCKFLDEEICENVTLNLVTEPDILVEMDELCNSSNSSDHESPRERLWREFENDVMASGNFLYDLDAPEEKAEYSSFGPASSSSDSTNTNKDSIQLADIRTAALDLAGNWSTRYKNKPKMLEQAETQSLMHRLGFSDETFRSSPDSCSGGFGSPIYIGSDNEPAILPALGEGLGPLLELNDGGFLRSMSPSLFKGSKNGGTLIMQVSRPTVLPADMGFEIFEVLQCMASGGLELLSKQVHRLMPLDDLSGKVIQQLAREASCSEERSNRFDSINIKNPLVMDSIASLSIEGLRIQSGMSDTVAPSTVTVPSEDVESLMDLSLSWDEWLRLDSGIFGNRDCVSSKSCCFESGKHVEENSRENGSLKCGLLGDDLVIAVAVQLRDPFRNFESVGTPMLALIQVKREFDSRDLTVDSKFVSKQVHVAGFVDAVGLWASRRQQRSGRRWLLANNIISEKTLISKSKPIMTLSRVFKKKQSGNILWSIMHGSPGFGDHLNQFNVRNPDIIFS